MKTKRDTVADVRNLYVVTVIATDANAASAEMKVTIIVTDVDEKPSLSTPATGAARQRICGCRKPDGNTMIDADDPSVEDEPPTCGHLHCDGRGRERLGLLVGGRRRWGQVQNHRRYRLPPMGTPITCTGILAFKSAPDFEAKGSAAGTNKYKVTIVASDQAGNRSTKNATVNVTNVNEPGSIELSTVQPQVGVPITATLNDPDGVVGTPDVDLVSGGRHSC